MKKFFLLFAAAALTLAACNKPQYIIPVDTDDPDGPEVPDTGIKETKLTVDITLQEGVNNTYEGTVGVMPGAKILEALDMTEAEFYKAMGTYSGSAIDVQTSQENNTIMFGVANANDTDNLKWIPSTSNNFGHWFAKDGAVCGWGDEAYFFTESLTEWGLDDPDAETLAGMWNFTVGCFPGRTVAGETYKATEVFFLTDDEDVEHYVYVQWVIKIEEAEEVKLNVVKTQEITYNSPFYGDYTHTDLVADIDMAAVSAAIGIDYTEADAYGVNPDGSFSLAPGKNWWYKVDGTIAAWGEGAGICINDDAGTNSWAWCMFPDETLGGQTCYGAFAFVNPATLNAYVVKVIVNIEGIDFLSMDVLVSYENGETEYTLTENNLAALAEALGVENVAAEEIGTTYKLKGINADGSVYEGDFTANNGFWYSSTANVTTWGSEDFTTYIEYRGDYTFGCGFWEESGATNTVKIGVGDAILTFNLTVDEAKSFDTEEAGVIEVTATQTVAAGYGGGVAEIAFDDVANLIGEGDWYLLDKEGGMQYTANGGFWFDADGNVVEWGDASFFIEPGENFPSLNTGIHPEHVTEAATFLGVIRIANPDSGKHVTVKVTINVTA